MWAVFRALERGWSVGETAPADAHRSLVPHAVPADRGAGRAPPRRSAPATCRMTCLRELKRAGFGDAELARLVGTDEDSLRERRRESGVRPAYKRIDTCAAEFESFTPYLYGTFERECEAQPTSRSKVVILGSGPNRIGQGIEFDYCCCHAAFALRDEGYETVMVNCNPETVSTDYDTVDRLYFEPLTFEDVSAVIDRERSAGGEVSCVVQYGGQTPLKLALQTAGRRRSGFSARRRTRSIWRKIASASRSCSGSWASPRRPAASRARPRRPRKWPRPSGSRSSSGPRTCWAAARWRSSTTPSRSIATCGMPSTRRQSIRSWSTSSSRTRSRSTWTRWPTPPARW